MEKNIKNVKKLFKDMWIYYTDPQLAQILKSYIDVEYTNVYDPTCWQWNLLSVFDDDTIKYWQEIDWDELEKCKNSLKNFVWHHWDTLESPWFLWMKFDCIVANPPFSISRTPKKDERFEKCWTVPTQSKADYAFLLHILYYLSDTWVAITLNFPWVLYRWWKEWEIRKRMIQKNYIDRIIQVPSWYFVDTNIQTVIIILKKNKANNSVEFEDLEKWKKILVGINQIIDNDYNLSVSQYIPEETETKEVDTIKLMSKARNQFVDKMIKDLAFDRQVCILEWRDHNIFIDWLIRKLQIRRWKNNMP